MINIIKYKYMVEFKLPNFVDEEFLQLMPKHRRVVKDFFNDNILQSYSLSGDNKRIWAIFLGKNYEEVTEYVKTLPLAKYMECEIRELLFEERSPIDLPLFSVN